MDGFTYLRDAIIKCKEARADVVSEFEWVQNQWKAQISALLSDIESWLAPLVEEGLVTLNRTQADCQTVDYDGREVGYQAESLVVRIADGALIFMPYEFEPARAKGAIGIHLSGAGYLRDALICTELTRGGRWYLTRGGTELLSKDRLLSVIAGSLSQLKSA